MKPFKIKLQIFLTLGLLTALSAVSPAGASTSPSVAPVPGATTSTIPAGTATTPTGEDQKLDLKQVEGEVFLQPRAGGDFQPLNKDSKVHPGDTIKTGTGSCRITYSNKTDVYVGPQSQMRIAEASIQAGTQAQVTTLELESGTLRAKLAKLKNTESRFEVMTPTAVATVRGTTLYLTTGLLQGSGFTELYVDESDDGVALKNRKSGDTVDVPAYSLSQALAGGEVSEPKKLDEKAQEKFVEEWENQNTAATSLKQFAIETAPLPGGDASGFDNPGLPDDFANRLDDTQQDRTQDKQTGNNPDDQEEQQSQDDTDNPPVPPDDNNPPDEGPPATAEELQMIRQEIALIRGEQEFGQADAELARISDSQTGKTFTDVHGNRVRVDQYVFQATPISVDILSLTARTGEYQNGVSVVMLNTIFNRPLTGTDVLRDLPWNDYMNIVESGQLTGPDLPGEFVFYDQFIVHEHGSAETEPDLYPLAVQLGLSNPNHDSVAFVELYGIPQLALSDQGDFWVQPLLGSGDAVAPNGSLQHIGGQTLGLRSVQLGISGDSVLLPNTGESGAQTDLFAGHPIIGSLDTEAGINALRDLEENDGDDFANHVHPAFIEKDYTNNAKLLGLFMPINDAGQVIDAPGFRIRGIRDVIAPNPLVTGGDYNLQMLFVFGFDGEGEGDGEFQEVFRIDALVTPEIFELYGTNGPNPAFPKSFIPDDEHEESGPSF